MEGLGACSLRARGALRVDCAAARSEPGFAIAADVSGSARARASHAVEEVNVTSEARPTRDPRKALAMVRLFTATKSLLLTTARAVCVFVEVFGGGGP